MFVFYNGIMTPNFFSLLVHFCSSIMQLSLPLLSSAFFWFFSSLPLFFSIHSPSLLLPLSCPPACCSFLNLWISEHHFLDFSSPQGDILIPALLFFHLISSLLSESPRQDVRWQCGPWRFEGVGIVVSVYVCVFLERWRAVKVGYSQKRGVDGQCHPKSNPTHDHRRRTVASCSLSGSKL